MIAGTGRRIKKQIPGHKRVFIGAACLLVLGLFMMGTVSQPQFADFSKKVSRFYTDEGWHMLKAANTVTSIVWDFRGYDTLGEESVLFSAAIGIFAMGFGLHARHRVHREVREK